MEPKVENNKVDLTKVYIGVAAVIGMTVVAGMIVNKLSPEELTRISLNAIDAYKEVHINKISE